MDYTPVPWVVTTRIPLCDGYHDCAGRLVARQTEQVAVQAGSSPGVTLNSVGRVIVDCDISRRFQPFTFGLKLNDQADHSDSLL